LYLEVVPLSFTVRVREDLALNQLRLSVGRSELTDAEIRELHRQEPLLYRSGTPVAAGEITLSNGLFLSLDLKGDPDGRVGYRARENAPLLDLTLTGAIDPEPYWEPVRHEEFDRVVLTEKKFYLLMSEEAVVIPPSFAAEMTAYDPTSGELRTHYAGFFDPGFGYDPSDGFHGSKAALEVRAHDVPFMIEHGQRVCRLTFERMLERPSALYGRDSGSSYQQQEEALGKHFVRPARPRPGRPGASQPGPRPGSDQLTLPDAGPSG
jgi:dCTP deaminase